ncbi:unnamed protein product [Urochloa decumbens]|uniref:Uncharacterized protein n=1 Tax=Urochloa decumbens TaxID=240449 RepID=A0ABC9CZP9_9POAL
MANFPIDPRPFASREFEAVPHDPNAPPLRLYAYIDGCYDKFNEDVAIAILYPIVVKEDFNLMAREMRSYFEQAHGLYEDPIPEHGPMYPLPFEAPRWMGPVAPGRSTASSSSREGGGSAAAGGGFAAEGGVAEESETDTDPVDVEPVVDMEFGAEEGDQAAAASLNQMTMMNAVPFGPAPPPVDNSALIVAKVLCDLPEEQEPLPLGDGRQDNAADVDLEILDAPLPRSTPRKRRRKMLREPLEVEFVRRSERLSKEVRGYKDGAAAEAAADATSEAIVPYEGIAMSPDHTAPHLSVANIQGIAVNFLQIQQGAVDASILEVSDDE